jgi:endonuclease III-like uncharacterized protein
MQGYMEQLSFIPETTEERLAKEVTQLREQYEKIRKGQFAKIAALTKSYNELHNQLEILTKAICNGQYEKNIRDTFFVS